MVNHADGNVECRGLDASEKAMGDQQSKVRSLNASHASPVVEQQAINSQVAS
jgi:hypothetical protein